MRYTNVYENSGSFDVGLRDYMYLIYKNMGISLLISAFVAFFVSSSNVLLSVIFGNRLISLVIHLAPVFYVFSFSKNIMSLSIDEAKNRLYIFSGLIGLSLSSLFVIYTKQSLVETFLTTSLTFGCMSLYGYKTKKDLTSLSSFLYMGIVGLFIASLLNIALRSSTISFYSSFIGVIIFTLYTACNVQKLKDLYGYISVSGSDVSRRIAILGALDLYVTFINLFLSLISFFGERRD